MWLKSYDNVAFVARVLSSGLAKKPAGFPILFAFSANRVETTNLNRGCPRIGAVSSRLTWDIYGYLLSILRVGNHQPQSARLSSYRDRIPQNDIHPRLNSIISAMIPSEITQYRHHTISTSLSI